MSQLTEGQLSEISHRHPSWPWALGMVVGCVVACFFTGVAFAAGVRADAKEQIALETKQREASLKAIMDQLDALRLDAARNERKLDAILSRLDGQRGRR